MPFEYDDVVGVKGLEPPTSCVSCMRSNHLSYTPRAGHTLSALRRDHGVELAPPRAQDRQWATTATEHGARLTA